MCIQTRLASHFYTDHDFDHILSTQQNEAHVKSILLIKKLFMLVSTLFQGVTKIFV